MAPEQPGIFVALSFYVRLTVSVPAVVFSASLKADRLTSPFTGWLIKKKKKKVSSRLFGGHLRNFTG